MKLMNQVRKYGPAATVAGSLFASNAFAVATPVDVSAATDQLSTLQVTILAIAVPLLIAAAVAVTVKWAKASIFG
jgi:hypothetical protein